MGGAKAHYDDIVAFSQTDFADDLKKITVPVLVMHGDDDQIVPYADKAATRRVFALGEVGGITRMREVADTVAAGVASPDPRLSPSPCVGAASLTGLPTRAIVPAMEGH